MDKTSQLVEEWTFDALEEKLKFKSMMLIKKLRIMYSGFDGEFEYDQYYHWRTQYEKFKKIHL